MDTTDKQVSIPDLIWQYLQADGLLNETGEPRTREKEDRYGMALNALLERGINVGYGRKPVDIAVAHLADAIKARDAAANLNRIYREAVWDIAKREAEEAKKVLRENGIDTEGL